MVITWSLRSDWYSIRIEVSDECAFDDGAYRFSGSAALGDLGALCALSAWPPQFSGATNAKLPDPFAFRSANRGAGHLAQLVGGKILGFASANKKQTFRLQTSGFVQAEPSRKSCR